MAVIAMTKAGYKLFTVGLSKWDSTGCSGNKHRMFQHREIFFHLKGDKALELAQRAYGVSILGDIPKLSGQGAGKLAPGVPVWAGWLD